MRKQVQLPIHDRIKSREIKLRNCVESENGLHSIKISFRKSGVKTPISYGGLYARIKRSVREFMGEFGYSYGPSYR